MKNRYLVTGAAGFIGFHATKKLAENVNNEIVLVDNLLRGKSDRHFESLLKLKNVTFLQIDLNSDSDTLPDVDYVLHLASLNGTENFYSRPFEVLESAVSPTIALLKRYRDTRIKNFVLSSTSEVYASAVDMFDWDVPTKEDVPSVIQDPLASRWSYASGKIAAEAACAAAQVQFGIPARVLRFHNVYGPRMGRQHFIPEFIERALHGDFSLHGYENTRAFIYVDDAVRATLSILHQPVQTIDITHVGNEDELTILEVAKKISIILGIEPTFTLLSAPPGSVRRRCPDATKINKLIGCERVSLDEGLRRTVEYYQSSSL